MGYSYSFMDNAVYGADDINRVFSKLTTQGVSLFKYSDGDNPLISLNDAVASIASPGVEYCNPDSCKLVYDADAHTYSLLFGNAFMSDGSIITIDEDGYDITDKVNELILMEKVPVYVCFYRDVGSNLIEISVSADNEKYESEMSVKIAVISGAETFTDKRAFSKTKLAPSSANIFETVNMGKFRIASSITTPGHLYATAEFDMGTPSYVYVWNELFPVQNIETTDGTELDYLHIDQPIGSFYAAFNRVNDELQLWAYSKSSYHDFTNFTVMLM